MSAGLTSARDVSMRSHYPGAGLAITLSYRCGHTASQAGGKFKVMPRPLSRIPLLCGVCHAAKKAGA